MSDNQNTDPGRRAGMGNTHSIHGQGTLVHSTHTDNTPGGSIMPNDLPCAVAWCDHDCRWEFETDGLPVAATVDDLAAQAHYLTGFGHPPFRWHSRLWPSGICVEQDEFPRDTDPRYVAEHGRLIIRGTGGPVDDDPWWTKDDLDCVTRLAVVTAQLAVDLTEAAALARAAPDRVDSTARIA